METNYDPEYWKQPCPKVKCKEDPCKCGLRFVGIPASLAEKTKPVNGAFTNAIVRYEDTGEIWIFDTTGFPVKIKEGDASQE